jgi:hypothetical protein
VVSAAANVGVGAFVVNERDVIGLDGTDARRAPSPRPGRMAFARSPQSAVGEFSVVTGLSTVTT